MRFSGAASGSIIRGAVRELALRTAEASVVVLVLATLVFLALRLLPGDPAVLVLGDQASAADLAQLRHRLHWDEPLYVQYLRFLKGVAVLDFGESLRRPGTSALTMVARALGPTARLAVGAVALGTAAGIALALAVVGPWFVRSRRWTDRFIETVAAMPFLSFAPLLTYVLAVRLRVVPLPGDPDAGVLGFLFASGLLAIPLGAQVARISRAALAETARHPFVTVAAAKGASPLRVWLRHALPASLGPIVAVVAAQLGALLGGAVVLERFFERKGLGTLILEAYVTRDAPVLEAAVVASGTLFVVTQSLAAIFHAVADPRVRR